MTRRRRGASAIEFALLLPVLTVLVGGMIDFSWYIQQRALVVRAVREGVRVGATTPLASTPDAATTAVTRTRDVLTGMGIDGSTADVTAVYSDLRVGITCDTIDTLTVNAIVPFTPIARIVPTPPNFTVTMTMMLEDGDCA